MSDLVRQFEETDSGVVGGGTEGEPEAGRGEGGGGSGGGGGEERGVPRGKKKPGLKAFRMFESSGVIMGMVSIYVHGCAKLPPNTVQYQVNCGSKGNKKTFQQATS